MKFETTAMPFFHPNGSWIAFHLELMAALAPFHMEQLLDPDFVPRKKDRKAFKSDSTILYFVLFKNIKSDAGMEIVRRAHLKNKGQLCWAELIQHYLGAGSITAELENNKLHDELSEKIPATNSNRIRLSTAMAR